MFFFFTSETLDVFTAFSVLVCSLGGVALTVKEVAGLFDVVDDLQDFGEVGLEIPATILNFIHNAVY